MGKREGVLFAFPDFYDPYRRGVHKLVELPGPILSLLRARRFHRIILFLLPHLAPAPDLLEAEMRNLDPDMEIRTVDCSDCVTGELTESMRLLRIRLKDVLEQNRDLPMTLCWGGVHYPDVYVGLAGLLLSGELPVRLIVVRSPEVADSGLPRFAELDFSAGIFSRDILDVPLASSDNVSNKISLRRRAEQFGIIGTHSIMQRVVDVCQILAPSPLPMLLLGETGTGKGLLAAIFTRFPEGRWTGSSVWNWRRNSGKSGGKRAVRAQERGLYRRRDGSGGKVRCGGRGDALSR